MTDSYVDELFALPADEAVPITYPVSRLVCDPERFEDDAREPISRFGMGVIYTATHDGRRYGLRQTPGEAEREGLLDRFYRPHHAMLTVAVEAELRDRGRCLIVDAHNRPFAGALVRSHFPHEEDPDELAAALLANARDGNVHIVIACDKAPKGVYDLARSVSAQSHLGFSLDVVEVTPYVPKDGPADVIMFVPNVRLSTEIVARTAVNVTFETGTPQPGVRIETTSVEEIEGNLATAAKGDTLKVKGRIWSDEELETLFLSSDDPVVTDLFLLAKQENFNDRFLSRSRKQSAAFNFYVRTTQADGSEGAGVFAQYVDGAPLLRFFLNWAPQSLPAAALADFKGELKALFGEAINLDTPAPGVSLAVIGENMDGLKRAVLKLRDAVERGRAGQEER